MTLHTCTPPAAAIAKWLESYPSEEGNYGHLLLEQKSPADKLLIDALIPYFESAHLDAREHFHAEIGLDLHPDAGAPGAHATYPACLPPTARRGLFGEVMAGLLTEHYSYVGKHKWTVPIFLFRYHEDVEHFLFNLSRDPNKARQVFGRFGSDFLGLCLDKKGEVVRFIAGEAKWRKQLHTSVVDELLLGKLIETKDKKKIRSGKGVWYEINRDTPVPHGMRQLQRLLQEKDPDGHAPAILSIDKALILDGGPPIPRTNLILLAGNDVPTRKKATSLIPWQATPKEYKAPFDLQVVELIVSDGEALIDALYDNLWKGVDHAAA